MKFDFSKHLGHIVAIPLISSCCFASDEQKYQDELTREMYKHSWRAHLSETWKCADIKAKTWWKAEMYEDSIFDVIPQAIADCMTHNAEFDKDKFTELQKNHKNIIEFHGATPDKMIYSQGNWNAVMLWNFIYRAMDDGIKQDYMDILREIVIDLARYYAKYDEKSKASLNTMNKNYIKGIQQAHKDIRQYIEGKGVNLVGYINEIKKISKEYRMIKAPQARIERRKTNDGNSFIIAQFPVHEIGLRSARWIEYKIEYTHGKDISVEKGEYKYTCVPTYIVPDGIVEYDDGMKQYNEQMKEYNNKVKNKIDADLEDEEKAPDYNDKIFRLRGTNNWQQILINEYPVHYTLSLKNLPKGYTKSKIEEHNIKSFGDSIQRIAMNDLSGFIGDAYNPSMSATEYLNVLLNKVWKKPEPTIEYKSSEYDPEIMEKIKEFKETFNLSDEEYTDQKIFQVLDDNNYNFEDAFNSLFGG